MMNSTVWLQTAGSAVRAFSTRSVYSAPHKGDEGPGCSEYFSGATIQLTCGRRPAFTSSARASSERVDRPRALSERCASVGSAA